MPTPHQRQHRLNCLVDGVLVRGVDHNAPAVIEGGNQGAEVFGRDMMWARSRRQRDDQVNVGAVPGIGIGCVKPDSTNGVGIDEVFNGRWRQRGYPVQRQAVAVEKGRGDHADGVQWTCPLPGTVGCGPTGGSTPMNGNCGLRSCRKAAQSCAAADVVSISSNRRTFIAAAPAIA